MDIGLLDDPCAKKETGKKAAPAKKPNPTPVQNNEKSRQANQGLVTLMSSKERGNALQKGNPKDKWNPVVGWGHVRGTHVAKAPTMRLNTGAVSGEGGGTATAKGGATDRAGSKPSRPAGKAAPKQVYHQPSQTFVQPRQPSVAEPIKLSSAQDKYDNWFGDSAKL